ncbi:MAG: c-type cytochrome [Paracoccaceae bacterium]|nr:c-type cytochrome [Paracoccaceae bacterium]MDG1369614.1 c-type cytochrome [Paracoccaceae bacterium]
MLLMSATPVVAGLADEDGLAAYEVCALCHSLDGVSRMAKFPKLAGQSVAYIEKQVRDFQSGRRDNDGGQMVSIVSDMSDEDITEAAEWFASQPAPLAETKIALGSGKRMFSEFGCADCHDEQVPDAVKLTAQHKAYLTKQMVDFRDGRRANDLGGAMRSSMQGISNSDIEQIADYLAATQRMAK